MPDITPYVRKNLRTRLIGRELHYFEAAGSTMDLARGLAEKGAPEGSAAIAGRQEKGRGRLSRSWLSPEGSLATSIVLRPGAGKVHLIPAVAALAVFYALRRLGLECDIKWPNDIMSGGKKICGILIENGFHGGELSFAIVGIGVNVNFDTSLFPEIAEIATSLSAETGRTAPLEEVALNIYTEFDKLYSALDEGEKIVRSWAAHMSMLGRRVSVNLGDRAVEGLAAGVNSCCNLLLKMDDGSVREISAGDVSAVREQAK